MAAQVPVVSTAPPQMGFPSPYVFANPQLLGHLTAQQQNGFVTWASTPNGPQQVILPAGAFAQVAGTGLANSPLPYRTAAKRQFSPSERAEMEKIFNQNQNPTPLYPTLAQKYNRSVDSIKAWFSRKRRELKKNQKSSGSGVSLSAHRDSGEDESDDPDPVSDSTTQDGVLVVAAPSPALAGTTGATVPHMRVRIANPTAVPPPPPTSTSTVVPTDLSSRAIANGTSAASIKGMSSFDEAGLGAPELATTNSQPTASGGASTKIKIPVVNQKPLPTPQPIPASYKSKPLTKATTEDSASDSGSSEQGSGGSSDENAEVTLTALSVEQFARRFKQLMAEDEIDDDEVSRMRAQVIKAPEDVRKR
ncbi:hypothetical protein M427DRAFT_54358 [Gonapodya prolifera JEL478]|uniref:Homeobox domain-containing protein n=1 Tax=Gonapodya prolifera (strain JEL478) TaxID=1344416 RepID=A0A139ALW5_GONPJ|nr:hypothetical protein M427DRAFT_54358 [Gonapodya prolifera JEL478]|eukprot:KXS17772.1 hypothetical protein M427DRAFT_54358 [Gonapodya prolifera JEL478]